MLFSTKDARITARRQFVIFCFSLKKKELKKLEVFVIILN
jgi:hypothetical protein